MKSVGNKSKGFSMIEVLVSLLLIVVGVLGMVAMQSKAIPYTQDSVQRNTAIMLAQDLLELIRTDPDHVTAYVKALGTAFPTPGTACVPTPTTPQDRVGCWGQRAMAALPGGTALGTGSFYICQNKNPGDASTCTGGDSLEIQLAWTVKAGGCMSNDATATTCKYQIRTKI